LGNPFYYQQPTMPRTIRCLLFCFLLPIISKAQSTVFELTPLPLNTLQSFSNKATNWKITGPLTGSYTDTKPKAVAGTGVLFNDFTDKNLYKSDANIFTNLEHGDMVLSLDFLIPKGSNSGIYLQGRYEVQLFDSWGKGVPLSSDCGAIYERWDESRAEGKRGYEGHPPLANASLAPNLWQHLEIEFQAPRFDATGKKVKQARFVKVVLNGVTVQENVLVSGPTRSAAFADEVPLGPLMIQGDHGPVAFRNIRYALLNDFTIERGPVTYKYYEGKFNNDLSKITPKNVTRSGKAEAIDVKLADDPNDFALVFDGTFTIKEPGEYSFLVKHAGPVKLAIDGQELMHVTDLFKEEPATRSLTAGAHTYTLSYVRNFSWAPAGIGLWISKKNSRPVALHASTSLPAQTMEPLIAVQPGREPELVRSFMWHDGKKKTHVLSVGYPGGVNYAYDLNQSALLQTWKGDFLNATDMWHERGEPQTGSPLGAAVVLPGRCPLALLDNPTAQLQDTLNDRTEIVYKGYTLDNSRNPAFAYRLKGLPFTDQFTPYLTAQSLVRTLKWEAVPAGKTLVLRMAMASAITPLGNNTYVIGDQQYYLQLLSAGNAKPEIIKVAGNKELILKPSSGTSQVQYSIIW
jgi:hypothetical protein